MVATDRERPASGYQLGGREKRGLLAGWRGGQVGAVAAGLATAVLLVRLAPGVLGGVLALLAVLAGVGLACWPVRGRSADEWVPVVARHAARWTRGALRWRSSVPWLGSAAANRTRGLLPDRGPFAGLSVEDSGQLGFEGQAFGLVRDRRCQTLTAVLAVSGAGFALLGNEDRDDRVSGWARVLATLARDGSVLHRLQWVERCVPDDLAGPRAYREAVTTTGTPQTAPEQVSYRRLLETAQSGGWRHELYLAVCIKESQRLRMRGDPAIRTAATDRLAREIDALERALGQAELVVEGVLGADGLRRLMSEELTLRPGGARASAWPLGCEAAWSSFRADGAWHATYWIAEWPRVDVGAEFLLPLVTGASMRRTLSMTMAPLAPLDATRSAERARVSGAADAALREKHGFAVTARAARDQAAVTRREAELAEGHASYRFSGFVTVSAVRTDELEASCEAVERAAALAHLELRRLYGAQDEGRLATLPLGRGLS